MTYYYAIKYLHNIRLLEPNIDYNKVHLTFSLLGLSDPIYLQRLSSFSMMSGIKFYEREVNTARSRMNCRRSRQSVSGKNSMGCRSVLPPLCAAASLRKQFYVPGKHVLGAQHAPSGILWAFSLRMVRLEWNRLDVPTVRFSLRFHSE